LSGIVWFDEDGDGVRIDPVPEPEEGPPIPGEPRVADVPVTLIDEAGEPVAETVTDHDGLYSFTEIEPGTYTVEFQAPKNNGFVDAAGGDDPALDSDVVDIEVSTKKDKITKVAGTTASFAVTPGEFVGMADAGLEEMDYKAAAAGTFEASAPPDPQTGGTTELPLPIYDPNQRAREPREPEGMVEPPSETDPMETSEPLETEVAPDAVGESA
jgi:serine-aspartate repeat-containing protein C/D/E